MEVKGEVTHVLDMQKGTSKAGKEWKNQTFVVKTSDEYNNLYPIEAFGDKTDNMPSEGDIVTAHFNIDAREYNGKYYTKLSLWKWEKEAGEEHAAPPTPPADDSEDSLPF